MLVPIEGKMSRLEDLLRTVGLPHRLARNEDEFEEASGKACQL